MIFITGGTGLVGSHLIFELLRTGEKIKALTRKKGNTGIVEDLFSWYNMDFTKVAQNLEWVEGDILDIYSLKDILPDVDYIYHCAAEISFDPSHKISMIKNNVEGTANIVNLALEYNIKKLCHVSSVAAFGRESGSSTVTEMTQRLSGSQHSGYSQSKFHSELEVWRGIREGLNAVIVNPSVIIGPGNRNSGSQKMFNEVYKGMRFFTNGSTGFVDVRDVVSTMIILMKKDISGERFCINSENLPYEYIFKKIALALNVKPPSISINPFVLKTARILDKIRSTVFRSDPKITKATVKFAFNKTNYSNQKIIDMIDYKFISIEESIMDTSDIYLKYVQNKKS